jgi:hypothetical protein
MSETPIRVGHPDEADATDRCGCCEGTALATLQPTENRPNLSAIAFRVGDHARFKASMLTSLASAAYPQLADLRTREDDDFSIALIDAWAAACDVLTFYQERLANEAYVGTAAERLSIGELARLIGYRLHPGAAAESDIVILMEDPPAAAPDVADLTVPAGTRVQSQPGPDETSQVFETLADLEARVAWNALRPRAARRILPGDGDSATWVEGAPSLQVGDAIVFVSRERGDEESSGFDVDSTVWDFRRITAVAPAADGRRTRIRWNGALDSVGASPTPGLSLYHLRERASLFGYNAPHPLSLSERQRDAYGYADSPLAHSPSTISGTDAASGDWVFEHAGSALVHLDAIYKSFVERSWIVIQRPAGLTRLYRITSTRDDSLAKYSISGKSSRLSLDTGTSLDSFESTYRQCSIYGGSVEIPLAETPLDDWVAGDAVELDPRADDLPEGRKLIFRGRRALLKATQQVVTLTADDGAVRALTKDAVVTLLDEPQPDGSDHLWRLQDDDGFVGTAVAPRTAFERVPAPDTAPEIVVPATLERVVAVDSSHSRLELTEALGAAFDRGSLCIHANVARAAHGEGVTEILGGGDPSMPFQKIELKQFPLTHRLAPTETGVESSLTVRIDGVQWEEVPDLYRRGAAARVYKTSLTDDGKTIVEFGDGVSGARPPAGRDNIVADHSRGLGRAGNVRAGQLTLPLDRPLGLKATDNALPATGGADPETAAAARRNAPIYTLTLGRVVSLTDYRDFALAFPGIAKAEARWVWQGETRRIVVTVAGDEGAEILPGSVTHANLLDAFRRLGDPLVAVDLLSYQPATFRLGLKVAVDQRYDSDSVLGATEDRLREAFSFDARGFGEMLALSEVAAAAHEVDGLKAIDIDLLYRTAAPQTAPIAHARLISHTGRRGADGTLLPAEILTLDAGPLDKLDLMT